MLYLGGFMPKVKRINREKILEGALSIIQTKGISGLNARSLACELNCSTQPIYSEYKSMDDLKEELKKEAEITYKRCVNYYLNETSYASYLAVGLGFIKFAKEHKGLFQYLYMQPQENKGNLFEDVNEKEIQTILVENYKLSINDAKNYHTEMSIYTYGLACALNVNHIQISEEEIVEHLTTQFKALMLIYRNEEEKK